MKEHPVEDRVVVLEQNSQLISLMTMIRDKDTQRSDFIFYSDRIIRLIVEEGIIYNSLNLFLGLNYLPVDSSTVITPLSIPTFYFGFRQRVQWQEIPR